MGIQIFPKGGAKVVLQGDWKRQSDDTTIKKGTARTKTQKIPNQRRWGGARRGDLPALLHRSVRRGEVPVVQSFMSESSSSTSSSSQLESVCSCCCCRPEPPNSRPILINNTYFFLLKTGQGSHNTYT
ncbi:hypothetical protein EJB05_19293, partial [Eragrostis curvula]